MTHEQQPVRATRQDIPADKAGSEQPRMEKPTTKTPPKWTSDEARRAGQFPIRR